MALVWSVLTISKENLIIRGERHDSLLGYAPRASQAEDDRIKALKGKLSKNETRTKSRLPCCATFAPPPFPKGNWPFSLISTISTGSPVRTHCFPPPENRGQKLTRNRGPQFGACLILSEAPTQQPRGGRDVIDRKTGKRDWSSSEGEREGGSIKDSKGSLGEQSSLPEYPKSLYVLQLCWAL